MRSIELKSTAFLIDEMITAQLKLESATAEKRPVEEITARILELQYAIDERMHRLLSSGVINIADFISSLTLLHEQLEVVLRECWNAQEVTRHRELYSVEAVIQAGIDAQTTNAARNKLMRQIDVLFCESDRTVLEKSYG